MYVYIYVCMYMYMHYIICIIRICTACTHSYLHVYGNVYGHLILDEYFCNLIIIYVYVYIYKVCAAV